MRSNVIVGNGAVADIVAKFEEHGSIVLASTLELFICSSELDIEPERSIVAAAEVVDAIVMAAGGNGWL